MSKFSAQQLKDFRAYERVQMSGAFNMFDPRARQATGLPSDRYSFVIKNYTALRDAAQAKS